MTTFLSLARLYGRDGNQALESPAPVQPHRRRPPEQHLRSRRPQPQGLTTPLAATGISPGKHIRVGLTPLLLSNSEDHQQVTNS